MSESSGSAASVRATTKQSDKHPDDLDARQTPTRRVAAWKLREQMKSLGPANPRAVRKPNRSKDGLHDEIDPNLPPAFRAAFARQRKQRVDDFNSMASIHTASSTIRTENSENDSSSGYSFDGHDSFASLGDDDDEDDEAYREGRNQMARQEIEGSRTPTSQRGVLRGNDFKFKKGGIQGTPLDFIAE